MEDIFNEMEAQVEEMQNGAQKKENEKNQQAGADNNLNERKDEDTPSVKKRIRRTKVEVEAERLAEAKALVKEAGEGAQEEKTVPVVAQSLMDIPLVEAIYRIGLELKVPKNNQQVDPVTGKRWQYRSVEDILEALSPIREKYGVLISFSSHPAIVGTFNYIVVEAAVRNIRGEVFTVTSSAREDVERPGNWAAQISGSCESYAKKYCLQSLFMIDDSKLDPVQDPDSVRREQAGTRPQPAQQQGPAPAARPAQLPLLKRGLGDWMSRASDAAVWVGTPEAFKAKILKSYRIEDDDMAILLNAIPEQPRA